MFSLGSDLEYLSLAENGFPGSMNGLLAVAKGLLCAASRSSCLQCKVVNALPGYPGVITRIWAKILSDIKLTFVRIAFFRFPLHMYPPYNKIR